MAKAEDLRARLLALVDADAAAFEPLSKAYAIPKEDPNREQVMEECLRNAAATPMEILRLSCEAIDLHSEMLEKGSVMMLSDVGTGVIFCWSALYGAALNVKVNTKSMADRAYAQAMNEEVDALVERYWKIAKGVYESGFREVCLMAEHWKGAPCGPGPDGAAGRPGGPAEGPGHRPHSGYRAGGGAAGGFVLRAGSPQAV